MVEIFVDDLQMVCFYSDTNYSQNLYEFRNFSLILIWTFWTTFLLIHNLIEFQTPIKLTPTQKFIIYKIHILWYYFSNNFIDCSPVRTYPFKYFFIKIHFFLYDLFSHIYEKSCEQNSLNLMATSYSRYIFHLSIVHTGWKLLIFRVLS